MPAGKRVTDAEALAHNRALWDAWTPINAGSRFYDVAGFRRGGSSLADYELAEIGPVADRDLLHLQCHFGLDTLSFARLGARVTGVDFSSASIRGARELARELGLQARFVEASIDALPDALQAEFDIVYTSRGVLGWLPDLGAWARVVAHFLRPGGLFYITEIHPAANAFHDDAGRSPELVLRWPYFARDEPVPYPIQGSYTDPSADVAHDHAFDWIHSLGDVVTSLADAGLRIELLHEWPFCAWELSYLEAHPDGTWRLPAHHRGELPLFFSLRARRPA